MTAKQNPLSAGRAVSTIAAATFALLAHSATPVSAVEIGSGNSGLNSPGYSADLQAAQNRLQRQQYQQLQQLQREQDRLTVQQPQPRPEVPRVKPGCQAQIYGNRTVTTCR